MTSQFYIKLTNGDGQVLWSLQDNLDRDGILEWIGYFKFERLLRRLKEMEEKKTLLADLGLFAFIMIAVMSQHVSQQNPKDSTK